jgi:uncharacterized protein (TIGR02118 family)
MASSKSDSGARWKRWWTHRLEELIVKAILSFVKEATLIKMVVTCVGGTYFDREYYVLQHLPLALKLWRPLGLIEAFAYFPADSSENSDGTVSIGIYTFSDETAMRSALASPVTRQIMDDVPHFTDAAVSRGFLNML